MESISKGNLSRDVLDNPLVVEAFTNIREALIAEWENNSDSSARDELWYTLKGLERFKRTFEVAVENAVLDSQLQEKQ
jgi:hypothetical protein